MSDDLLRKHGMAVEAGASVSDRFWCHVSPEPNTGCWIWIGPKGYSDRYGGLVFRHGRGHNKQASVYAHRLSWLLHRGDIPDGTQVLHRCDIPLCVNPDHLFLGTHADNMADKISKGRHRFGVKSGSASPNARLTDDGVSEIRALIAERVPRQKIADRYGVSKSAINLIAKGKTWASGSRIEVRDACR